MSTSGGPIDRATLEDLAAASRILADQGVFDTAGHVSMRHPGHPKRFLMSRPLPSAPAMALGIADHAWSISELIDTARVLVPPDLGRRRKPVMLTVIKGGKEK